MLESTESPHEWSIYWNAAALEADIAHEGPNPVGYNGSNWVYGYTQEEAEEALAGFLRGGYSRGSRVAPRF